MTEIVITPRTPQAGRAETSAPETSAPDASGETGVDAAGVLTAQDGAAGDQRPARRSMDPMFGVRTADIEPYTGLRYLSKLFRMIAVVLVVLLIAEVVWGLKQDGVAALSTLLAEVSRLIVLAGLLWGVGDLAILLIDVGHDVRAARILIGRQTAHLAQHAQETHVAGPAVGAPRGDRA